MLVEKPSLSPCPKPDIFAAAEKQGVVAMEAMPAPAHHRLHRLIQDAIGRIGTIRARTSESPQYSLSRYDRFRAGEILNAFKPELGNAAIVDVACTAWNPRLICLACRSHTGHSVYLHNGFEGGGSIQFEYEQMIADVTYSKIVGVVPSTIIGEDGAVTINVVE